LLPDARVLIAGGCDATPTSCDGVKPTGQIYSPPYLFKPNGTPIGDDRPLVMVEPLIHYGTAFPISTSIPVSQACLIGLGAATHSFDQNQRYVPLTLTWTGDENIYNVAAPAHAFQAPPGYYMFFVVADGVPSKATMVKLEDSGLAAPPPNEPSE